jgi:hypothetical protein
LHRPDDVLVAGTPAEVALDALADLVLAGVRVVLQQVDRRHDHAGRTEAALEPVHLVEGLLHRVQLALRRGDPLDRRHLAAVGLHGEDGAALHGLAVEVDGAGAAVAGVAADDGADLPQLLPQVVDEECPRFDVVHVGRPVDPHRNLGHESSSAALVAPVPPGAPPLNDLASSVIDPPL